MIKERRYRIDLMTQAELAIQNAMSEVELIGCDINLTESIMALQKAKDLVSDYLDSKEQTLDGEPEPPKPPSTPPGAK